MHTKRVRHIYKINLISKTNISRHNDNKNNVNKKVRSK